MQQKRASISTPPRVNTPATSANPTGATRVERANVSGETTKCTCAGIYPGTRPCMRACSCLRTFKFLDLFVSLCCCEGVTINRNHFALTSFKVRLMCTWRTEGLFGCGIQRQSLRKATCGGCRHALTCHSAPVHACACVRVHARAQCVSCQSQAWPAHARRYLRKRRFL